MEDLKAKALAVVLNETRGSQATLRPLIDTGLSRFDWTLAYCGAKPKSGVNPYTGVAEYMWEYEEPATWIEELQAILPQNLCGFFLDPKDPEGVSSSSEQIQLWVSAWIQNVFRLRALENILSLGLETNFDWIFFVRSDYFFSSPIASFPREVKEVPTFMVGDSYGGINDRFAGIPSNLVESLSFALDYTTSDFIGRNDELFRFMKGQFSKNPETLLWFQLNKAGLLEEAKFVGQMGFCVRLEGDSSRWSSGFWSRRRALYVKYPSELLLSNWCAALARLDPSQKLLFLLAKISRAAGTQPRLFLAPLLALQGEFQLGLEVFRKSKREFNPLILQLVRDIQKICRDTLSVTTRKRKWSP